MYLSMVKKLAQKGSILSNGLSKKLLPIINPLLDEKQTSLIKTFTTRHNVIYSSDITRVPKNVQQYIEEKAKLCQPDKIHICDGTDEENKMLLDLLEKNGSIQRLKKMDNW